MGSMAAEFLADAAVAAILTGRLGDAVTIADRMLSPAGTTPASAPHVRTSRISSMRNAMLPVITVIGDQAASLLNGAVVIETIFGFPGVGKLMIDSILQRDFNVVLAAILVTAFAIFLMNLVIDLAYALLDPRIRY